MSAPQCYGANWSTVEGIKSRCRVEQNGCWVWLGGCCGNTPKLRAFDPKVGAKRAMSGARAMWLAAFGREARNLAFSACATRLCVNPVHLREARTQGEMMDYLARVGRYRGINVEQKIAAGAKGRAAQGITDTKPEVVLTIFRAPAHVTHAALARETGVHPKSVGLIRRGLLYRHVTGAAA